MAGDDDGGAPVVVAALYRFTPFADPETIRDELHHGCTKAGVRGTLLVAREGINGTIAGPRTGIDDALRMIRALPGCADLSPRESHAATMPFHRMKVRVKSEIVTMGVRDIDPRATAGTYVDPVEWNRLISDPEVVVIDTRNDYEVEIGTFAGAVHPNSLSFREFPAWFARNYADAPDTTFAMFCTGGIRCEKATALVRSMGCRSVFHLKGGILGYLETVPPQESLWQGECFVFDQRTAVGPGLRPGSYDLCHACRRPIDGTDKTSPHYRPGISCPRCHDRYSPAQQARFAERQRQMDHAGRLGIRHLGATAGTTSRRKAG